jgi:hypothetical protein
MGGCPRACLETIFRAGSCCLRDAGVGLCRSCCRACHHETRRHALDDLDDPDGLDDLDGRSGWGDRNCLGEPGCPCGRSRRGGRGALAFLLYLQKRDGRDARSSVAAGGWFPLRLPEFLPRGGSCSARKNRSALDGGSRLRGAAGDRETVLCDRLTAFCGRGRAFRDRALQSCRGHALRRRDARNVAVGLASAARSQRDLLPPPQSGWAHSVRDRHLLRRWRRQRGRPSLLRRSRAAYPRRRTARRRRAKRMPVAAW